MSYAYNTLPWLVVDEDWYVDPQACQRTKVREIRYDHGRRYMVQSNSTDPNADPRLRALGDAVWTEFDGGNPARDLSITNNNGTAVVSDIRQQNLGAWQYDSATAQIHFFHTDHLGTTQIMTNAAGQIVQYQSFTAFGEPADGWPFASLTQPTSPLSRYGFAGAHGYEGLPPPHADQNFPYLHLGARYYDPEIGRFLQRDPIGIRGGLNTYAYCHNNPIAAVDPNGTHAGYLLIAFAIIAVMDYSQYANAPAPGDQTYCGSGGWSPMGYVAAWYVGSTAGRAVMGAISYLAERANTPTGPRPPGWNESWEWGPPSGEKSGSWRWWDTDGGEWRWHTPDTWHNDGHWDYNPWDSWSSPWQNIPAQ